MIIITGGAGFIGSAVVWYFNKEGIDDIIIVDSLKSTEKWRNLVPLKYYDYWTKEKFRDLIVNRKVNVPIDAVIHFGACSSTTEKNADYLMDNNFKYSVDIAKWCLENGVKFYYASSAATYGAGANGYQDSEELTYLEKLMPLNMYGYSKHLFDLWVVKNNYSKYFTGLKFFNVYGPNEYHKGDMRSVVNKAFDQIKETGVVKLFKSYNLDYKDGWQLRDFVYVKDIAKIMFFFLMENKKGIYNIGTGKARSFYDLALNVFKSMDLPVKIEYIEMPENLRSNYQYFTQADIGKLRFAGYKDNFYSLEDGIADYVKNYLLKNNKYLK